MRFRSFLDSLENRVARLLGLDPGSRTAVVRTMLHRPRGDAAGYWLQLLISAALATLGLALDSTAVVIGAMLIAPLMRPIVELAMGLATGSAPLVFRTGFRSIGSVVVVVLASAAFTWLLPFHEATPELLARTAPSLLDLFVAAACAVAGAYAVVMTSNDVATTAAGTSIGISLVPPLCTAGYGLSIGDWHMAQGAGLLFTANITGIITIAGVVFMVTGFGQVDVRQEERGLDADADIGTATRLGRMITRKARLGAIPRVVFPLLLLGAISMPLQSAVEEMSRRSEVRQRVSKLLTQEKRHRVVQYSLDLAAGRATLRVVVVGDPASARSLEHLVRAHLAQIGERDLRVVVWAVPDARAVSALSARLDDLPLDLSPPPPPPEPPSTYARVATLWPATEAGPIIATWISESRPPQIRVTHLGTDLTSAAREVLTRALTEDTEVPAIETVALVPLTAELGDEARWLPLAIQLIDRTRNLAAIHLCTTMPPPSAPTRRTPPRIETNFTREAIRTAIMDRAGVVIAEGTSWNITPSLRPCPAAPEPPPVP